MSNNDPAVCVCVLHVHVYDFTAVWYERLKESQHTKRKRKTGWLDSQAKCSLLSTHCKILRCFGSVDFLFYIYKDNCKS